MASRTAVVRTHHNLAEVAGRYKAQDVMPLARALSSYLESPSNDSIYRTAHYDPIILGFILGRSWPECQEDALAAIAADLEYDKMIVRVSPKAERVVKGIDVSKLEFKL